MTFTIDTGTPEAPKATPRQYDGQVTFRGFGQRAERTHRQIIAAIECCETAADVDDTLTEFDLVLDALFLDWPVYSDAIKQAAEDQKAIVAHGTTPSPDTGAPVAMTPTAQTNVLNKAF